jgi:hypothetical protein
MLLPGCFLYLLTHSPRGFLSRRLSYLFALTLGLTQNLQLGLCGLCLGCRQPLEYRYVLHD